MSTNIYVDDCVKTIMVRKNNIKHDFCTLTHVRVFYPAGTWYHDYNRQLLFDEFLRFLLLTNNNIVVFYEHWERLRRENFTYIYTVYIISTNSTRTWMYIMIIYILIWHTCSEATYNIITYYQALCRPPWRACLRILTMHPRAHSYPTSYIMQSSLDNSNRYIGE